MGPVLITGANGFIGRHLVVTLRDSGIESIPMVRTGCGLPNEVVADFCDDRLPSLLQEVPPVSAVVHAGARIGWDGCSRAELFKPNVLATAQLADWAQQRGCYFVFASAALIAGEHNTHISAETSLELHSLSDYLYCKWLAEHLIATSGIMHATLRISGVFGANGPRHLGLNNAIRDALHGKPPIQYGDGKIKRNYIYVKDLCRSILYCLEKKLEGTLLVSGSHTDSLAHMLRTICNVLLPGTRPERHPGDEGHDQIIEPSPLLPQTRTFKQAIDDMARETL